MGSLVNININIKSLVRLASEDLLQWNLVFSNEGRRWIVKRMGKQGGISRLQTKGSRCWPEHSNEMGGETN